MREKYLVTEDSAPLIFFFEILISAFSLLGSKVVTTSITYCISISSAVTQKHSIDLQTRFRFIIQLIMLVLKRKAKKNAAYSYKMKFALF